MDTSKPPTRTSSRWKILSVVSLGFFATAVVSFMMWKSYLLAATALGSGVRWGRPGNGLLDVDSYDATPRLRFKRDGTFKIAVFEDLHFGEGEDNRKCSTCIMFVHKVNL
jgi:hypothetical protein